MSGVVKISMLTSRPYLVVFTFVWNAFFVQITAQNCLQNFPLMIASFMTPTGLYFVPYKTLSWRTVCGYVGENGNVFYWSRTLVLFGAAKCLGSDLHRLRTELLDTVLTQYSGNARTVAIMACFAKTRIDLNVPQQTKYLPVKIAKIEFIGLSDMVMWHCSPSLKTRGLWISCRSSHIQTCMNL